MPASRLQSAQQSDLISLSSEVAIAPLNKLKLSCEIRAHKTQSNKRPALIAFYFHKAEAGEFIKGRVHGLSFSTIYGPYLYVGRIGQSGTVTFETTITPPNGTKRVSAALHKWGATQIEVINPFEIAVIERAEPPLGKMAASLIGGDSCKLTAIMDVKGSHKMRPPALATLFFRGKDGEPLDGPFSGALKSEKYGPFVYLGKPGHDGRLVDEVALPVPPGAVSVEVTAFRGSAKAVALAEPLALSVTQPKVVARHRHRDVLAEIDVEVQQGETYEITFRAGGSSPLTPRFALVTPQFFDANGTEVGPAENLPVSPAFGPYRYLTPSSQNTNTANLATATLIAPARATRMHAEILRWNGTGDFGKVEAKATSLQDTMPVLAQGELLGISSSQDIVLSGKIKIATDSCTKPAVLQLLFKSADGDLLLTHAEGLQASDQFLNFWPLKPRRDDGILPFHLTFKWPAVAQRLVWRLRSEPGQIVAPIGELALRPLDISALSTLAELPASARSQGDLSPDMCDLLRSTSSTSALWDGIARHELTLLGEAFHTTNVHDWMTMSADLKLEDPLPATAPIVVCPLYFDSSGALLPLSALCGCTSLSGIGLARYATSGPMPAGPAFCRESFLTPPDAAFVAFYVLSQDGATKAKATRLSALKVPPDSVHAELDTTRMDQRQIEQAIQIAERTGDLPSRRALAAALASWVPKDLRLKQRAQALANEMVDLDPQWLPPLQRQAAFNPDPVKVLHLFKVIYPDESTGGAVRSTAIVEAQAARGLRPIVCMPLNSSPMLAAEDGIIEVERKGVLVCYPHYSGFIRKKIEPAKLLSLEAVLWNRVARTQRTGLIHAASGFRGYENALKGIAVARANNLPFLYEVRSFHEHTWRPADAPQMSDRLTELRMAQENRCMAAADAVVTISQAMMRNLAERGVPEERLFFVPNAIDPAFETRPAASDVTELRLQQGILDKTTIGYISNFSQREGHRILLDAFTQLVADGHDLHLVMVGDGPERAKILHEAQKRNLAERVIMPGNVDHAQIRTWYHAIDLFVVPRIQDFASDYVTPLKPFEAMSQGIPLVMSDRPVTAEIAGDKNERASVFPTGDSLALAGIINAELADRPRLIARAALAHDWVMAERVWSNVVQRYDTAYEATRKFHAARRKERIS